MQKKLAKPFASLIDFAAIKSYIKTHLGLESGSSSYPVSIILFQAASSKKCCEGSWGSSGLMPMFVLILLPLSEPPYHST